MINDEYFVAYELKSGYELPVACARNLLELNDLLGYARSGRTCSLMCIISRVKNKKRATIPHSKSGLPVTIYKFWDDFEKSKKLV